MRGRLVRESENLDIRQNLQVVETRESGALFPVSSVRKHHCVGWFTDQKKEDSLRISSFRSPKEALQTESPRALRGYVEKEKGVKHRSLAAVPNRPKSAGRMRLEISNGHFAARDKRGDPSKQTKRNERSSEKLDHARQQALRIMKFPWAAKNSKQFLRTMTCKQAADHKPCGRINAVPILPKEFLHGDSPFCLSGGKSLR
jgi:hypothetical protein